MNSIVRSLLLLAAVGVSVIVLLGVSDDSEALDCVQNKVNFDSNEVIVYYGGSPISPLNEIEVGYSIYVVEKTGYHNVTLNGAPYCPDIFGYVILASDRETGIVIRAEKIQYSISFSTTEEIDGDLPDSISGITIGSGTLIQAASLSKIGYSFDGWNTSPSGTGDDFQPQNYTIDENFITNYFGQSTTMTLYPKWVPKQYFLSFNLNSGIGQLPQNITERTIDAVVTIPSVGITRVGYIASVWNTSPNGGGLDISPGSLTLDADFIDENYGNNTAITLYPKWVPIRYSIGFSKVHGETGTVPAQINDITIGSVVPIESAVLTRTGYDLNGWNTAGDGSGNDIQVRNHTIDADFITDHFGQGTTLTLYPKWVPRQYSLSFNANSGNGDPPPIISGRTIGAEISIPAVNVTRTGYTSTVWNTMPNGGGTDFGPTRLIIDAAFIDTYFGNGTVMTLYSKWVAVNYSIEYDSTVEIGGELPNGISGLTIGSGTYIQYAVLTRTGYNLNGWNTSPDGSGDDFQPGNYLIDASFITDHFGQGTTLTLYPKWVPKQYSISFDLNSGTGQLPQNITERTIGQEVTISSVGITRIGYTASVWNTSPNGNGLDVEPGPLSIDAGFIGSYFGNNTTITLYPKWVKISYSIDFRITQGVTGTLPDTFGNITIGSSVTIHSAVLVRTGYRMDGWNTSSDGTGDDIRPGSYTVDSDFITDHFGQNSSITLYPKWIAKEYSVSFDLNQGDGQCPQGFSGRTIGSEISVPTIVITRTGYTSTVWNTSSNGTGSDVSPGPLSIDAAFIDAYFGDATAITLYPKWVEIRYSITFGRTEGAIGELPSPINGLTIGSGTSIRSPVLSRIGYDPDGWNTSPGGTGDDIQSGDYTIDAGFITDHFGNDTTITLYPKWVPRQYSISFNLNSGTGQLPQTISGRTIDAAITISPVNISRVGYTSSIWNTSSDGSGLDVSPGVLSMDAAFIETYYRNGIAITLYPKWVKINYSICYRVTQGVTGTVPDPVGNILIDSPITIRSAALTRTGYDMDGWNTSSDGSGDDFQPGGYIVDAGFITDHLDQGTTLTLYPKWIPRQYSISFNLNSGTGQLPQTISGKTIGSEISIPSIRITRTGYTASVWNTSADGTGDDFQLDVYSLDASIISEIYGQSTSLTLYPKWVQKQYSVSFDLNSGTGQMPQSISGKTIGTEITIPAVGITRIGYTASVWNTSPDGSGLDLDPRRMSLDSVFIETHYGDDTTITLYPKWVAIRYSIGFNTTFQITGTIPDLLDNLTIGSVVQIRDASLSRTGYTMNGWNTSPDGSGDDFQPGSYTVDSEFITGHYDRNNSLILYPKWIAKEYSLSFDLNSGVGQRPQGFSGRTIGSEIAIPAIAITRTGYTSTVWNTASDGTGLDVSPGDLSIDASFIDAYFGDATAVMLYPKWNEIHYSIIFSRTVGASGELPSPINNLIIGAGTSLPTPVFTRTGYRLGGWNTSADGTGEDFQPGNCTIDAGFITDHFGNDTTITLYPKWIPKQYSISFNINSGTGQLPSNISGKTIDAVITVPFVGITRVGYISSIWNTSSNGNGLDVSPGSISLDVRFIDTYFGDGTAITLYPKWDEIHFSITFDRIVGTIGELPASINDLTIDSGTSVPSPALTITGYDPDGWNTSPDGSGDDFRPGRYTIDAEFIIGHFGQNTIMTLYPKWIPRQYSISFNPNHGSGQLPSNISGKVIDSVIGIPSVGLNRTGYTASVWNTSLNGTGSDINPGDLTIDASFIEAYFGDTTSITLYPKWNTIQYSIIYDSVIEMRGTLPDSITGLTIGSGTSIDTADLKRTGYRLDGWNTSPYGTGEDFQPCDFLADADFIIHNFIQGTSLTLYPKWVQNEYTLSFDLNHGDGQLPSNITGRTIGNEIDIPTVGITRVGYTVSVWNTSPNGNGLDLDPRHLTLDSGFIDSYFGNGTAIALYPKWIKVSYSVSFDSTEEIRGALPNSIDNITIDSVLTIQSSALSRTGYDLDGWNTSPDGTGVDFQPRDYNVDVSFITGHYAQSNSFTLYPKWVPKGYSVSFDPNSGNGQLPGNITGVTIVSGADIPAVGVSRAGYSSSVWNTSPDGSGADISPGHLNINGAFIEAHLSDNGSITLYPRWVKNDYSINFDTAEEVTGTMPASLINFRIDSTITIPSVSFSRTGYGVQGWNTSPDGTGRLVDFGELEVDSILLGDIFGDEKVISLYPSWTLNIYSIILTTERGKCNGWTMSDEHYVSEYSVESAEITLPIPEADDRFHSFLNWEDVNGNAVYRIASGSTGDVDLRAVWVENVYPVTATINGRIVNLDLTVSSEMPVAEPEDGFTFKGWYYIDENGNEVRFESMSQMTENMTIYAVFEPTSDDPDIITACVIALVVFFAAAMLFASFRR